MVVNVSRRSLLAGAAVFAADAALDLRQPVGAASMAADIRVGAIRWDAWYKGTSGSNAWSAAHNLDAAQYHFRAPFFAKQVSSDRMSILGTQSSMDEEILYAQSAGLKFWAFCQFPLTSDLSQGWKLYQASKLNANINWCYIYSYGGFHNDLVAKVIPRLFRQSNYERVLGRRPLLFLVSDGGATGVRIAADIIALRRECSDEGLGNPYIVSMGGSPTNGKSYYDAVGSDAISNYGYSFNTSYGTFASLDIATRAFWAAMVASGIPYLPCGTVGWDRRPRIEHPLPAEAATQKPYNGMSNNFATATPSEIAIHTRAMLTFINHNLSACPTGSALLYAWDEFDEGGWLCPTWTKDGPDTSRLSVLKGLI